MTSVEFAYWLQGLFELANPTQLDANQTELIKKHLNMVFYHEIDKKYPKEEQDTLTNLHTGGPYKGINFPHDTDDILVRC